MGRDISPEIDAEVARLNAACDKFNAAMVALGNGVILRRDPKDTEITRLHAALDAATQRAEAAETRLRDATKWRPMDTAPKGEDIWKRPRFLAKRRGTIIICWWEDDRFSKRPKPYWSGTHANHDTADARRTPPDGWLPFPATDDDATHDAARTTTQGTPND